MKDLSEKIADMMILAKREHWDSKKLSRGLDCLAKGGKVDGLSLLNGDNSVTFSPVCISEVGEKVTRENREKVAVELFAESYRCVDSNFVSLPLNDAKNRVYGGYSIPDDNLFTGETYACVAACVPEYKTNIQDMSNWSKVFKEKIASGYWQQVSNHTRIRIAECDRPAVNKEIGIAKGVKEVFSIDCDNEFCYNMREKPGKVVGFSADFLNILRLESLCR